MKKHSRVWQSTSDSMDIAVAAVELVALTWYLLPKERRNKEEFIKLLSGATQALLEAINEDTTQTTSNEK